MTTYLNHAGTSWPKPQAVREAVQEALTVDPARWPARFNEAHQAIADFFGVEDVDQILLTPGCTSALSVGISDAWIPAGQRVLTSRWEHHALHRPWRKLADAGVRTEYIPAGRAVSQDAQLDLLDLDWLEDALSEGDVALVAITAACNVTGELLPVPQVIELAHRHGVLVLIDAAQVVGWMRLNLPKLGADLVAFGGHKGLQGPWGIGGLYLSHSVRMQCVTATCELPAAGTTPDRGPRPGYCDVGSVDQIALAGLHAAIKLLGQQDLEANLERARQQIARIRAALEGIEGLRTWGGHPGGMPSLALDLNGFSSGEIASRLTEQGLTVGSGLQCAPLAHETLGTQENGLVRLSVGIGQADGEIDEAIDRLVVTLGQRH